MNVNWTMKKTNNIFHIILLGIYLLIWVAYLRFRMDIHPYRFLTVIDIQGFLILSIGVPCLPLVIWVLTVITVRKSREGFATILLALYIPAILAAFFLGAAELLCWPSTCSYTTNIDDLATILEVVDFSSVTVFPGTVPENAEDVQFCYCYQSTSSDTIYIGLTWKTEDEQEFEELIQPYVTQPYDGTTYNSGCLQKGNYYCNAVLFDNQINQIGFIISNREELLPNKVDEIVKAPEDILTIGR